jgi:hypothetical protein
MTEFEPPKGSVPQTLFGFRPKGEHGWRIEQAALRAEDLPKALSEKGCDVQDLRIIERSWAPRWAVGLRRQQSAIDHGWLFDQVARCWRPPDEPVTEPPGDPVDADASFTLRTIMYGSIWIDVTGSDVALALEYETLLFPITPLVHFVRLLESGGQPHTTTGREDQWIELHAFDRDRGRVRFLVRELDKTEGPKVDVIMDRARLVRSFRTLFGEIATHPFFPHMYANWAHMDDDAYEAVADGADSDWEAGVRARIFEDDYDRSCEFEAERIAEHVSLSNKQKDYVERLRHMLLNLEIPDGWL